MHVQATLSVEEWDNKKIKAHITYRRETKSLVQTSCLAEATKVFSRTSTPHYKVLATQL